MKTFRHHQSHRFPKIFNFLLLPIILLTLTQPAFARTPFTPVESRQYSALDPNVTYDCSSTEPIPATTSSYFTDPTPITSSSETEVQTHKELSGYSNYGAADGRVDILYTSQAATWHFSLPPSVDPTRVESAFFRISIIADDHYDVDPSRYTFAVWLNGARLCGAPVTVPHGAPYGGRFTNWIQLDYPVPLSPSEYTITIANQSSTSWGDWLALDWIELNFNIGSGSPPPTKTKTPPPKTCQNDPDGILTSYNVKVSGAKSATLKIICDAVKKIAAKLSTELNLKFKVLGQKHRITVSSTNQERCRILGTDQYDQNCTLGDLDTGAEMHLNTKDVNNPKFKEGLVIHEFGHLFTNNIGSDPGDGWQGEIIQGNQTSGWNGNRNIYDFLWVFGSSSKSKAQEVAAHNFPGTYSSYPDDYWQRTEATADAFAMWVLNTFQDDKNGILPDYTKEQARCVVNYFFRKIFYERGKLSAAPDLATCQLPG